MARITSVPHVPSSLADGSKVNLEQVVFKFSSLSTGDTVPFGPSKGRKVQYFVLRS